MNDKITLISFSNVPSHSQECTDVTDVLGLQFNSDSTQCTTAPLGGGQCLMQLQKSQHEYICKCKEIKYTDFWLSDASTKNIHILNSL